MWNGWKGGFVQSRIGLITLLVVRTSVLDEK